MPVVIVNLLEVVDIGDCKESARLCRRLFIEIIEHIMPVIQSGQAILMRHIRELFLGADDRIHEIIGIVNQEAEYRQRIADPEICRSALLDLINRSVVCRIAGRDQIRRRNRNTDMIRAHAAAVQLIGQIFRHKNYRNHREAVQMEAVAVTETDRTEAHVQCQPAVNHPDVDV